MAGPGRRFTKDDPRANRAGRKLGSRNRWRKADIERMREHVQEVLDDYPGGVNAFLRKLMRGRSQAGFVSILRDLIPKPPAKVEADATVTVRWQDEPAKEDPK